MIPRRPEREARTVAVRVQVIDLAPRVADLVVPAYLGADDLALRIARDLGLQAWWEDGGRRRFWLRARGRVLGANDKLEDVGVVPYELIHLLPEPRPGAPVAEREGDVDEVPTSLASRLGRVAALVGVVAAWAVAAATSPGPSLALLGGVGVAWCAASACIGRDGVGLVFLGRVLMVASLPSVPALALLGRAWWPWSAIGGCGLLVGAALGWLAWMGPVEPIAPADPER